MRYTHKHAPPCNPPPSPPPAFGGRLAAAMANEVRAKAGPEGIGRPGESCVMRGVERRRVIRREQMKTQPTE